VLVIWQIVLSLSMKKPIKTNVKFKDYSPGQTLLLPPSLDEMIEANHPVRIVNRVIDQIEIDPLIDKYKGGGTSSYHPRMLLKVVVFAYLSNIYSSRRMEAALKENIFFMWISGMSQPDHNTLNRFRSERLKGVLKQVFGKVVELLVEEGLVNLKEVYTDGTKIESKANRYTFVWGKAIVRSRERIKKQLEELKPAYNWQISTQDQFILHYTIHQNPTDTKTLPSHLTQFNTLYGQMPDTVTADAGYGSEQNYLFLAENEIRAFVKDNYFDKDQHDKGIKNPFSADKLYYDQEKDCYYCPMGQPMKRIRNSRQINYDKFSQTYAYYQAQNCQGCPLRGMCHKGIDNRIIEINHQLKSLKAKARTLLLSEEGIKHRKKRPWDVEPVFGNIKYNKGFMRFMLGGCDKVEIEAGLLSIAHNLKKWSC
jgi:transposase